MDRRLGLLVGPLIGATIAALAYAYVLIPGKEAAADDA
jgi:hypothetical protein